MGCCCGHSVLGLVCLYDWVPGLGGEVWVVYLGVDCGGVLSYGYGDEGASF